MSALQRRLAALEAKAPKSESSAARRFVLEQLASHYGVDTSAHGWEDECERRGAEAEARKTPEQRQADKDFATKVFAGLQREVDLRGRDLRA